MIQSMLNKSRNFLGAEIDNSPLILWRIFWGFLIVCESVGAIVTGWVQRTFIEAEFTFSFIGLEWLQPLPGQGMHIYYAVMALLGVSIMLGYRYKLSSALFFIMWTAVYLMQKTHYNNHYYLMVVIGFLMILLPANQYKSLDVKLGYVDEQTNCQRWNIWIFVLLIGLIYVTASLNKIHPDWLNARPLNVWFNYKSEYPMIGALLAKEWFQYTIAYGGIFYDGLIFFILLNKKTRNLGFILSLIFNLFNSAVFQIGVFPYMMIASTVLFYSGEQLNPIFFKRKASIEGSKQAMIKPAFALFVAFFAVNLLLPLRHHLFEGDVHWTEEGHRLSWQMMLRAKSGVPAFEIVNKEDGLRERIKLDDLTRGQRYDFGNKPDLIWQYAQRVKKKYQAEGIDVEVYVRARVRLNGFEPQFLIDPEVDLASVPWDRFKHSDWILDENRPTE